MSELNHPGLTYDNAPNGNQVGRPCFTLLLWIIWALWISHDIQRPPGHNLYVSFCFLCNIKTKTKEICFVNQNKTNKYISPFRGNSRKLCLLKNCAKNILFLMWSSFKKPSLKKPRFEKSFMNFYYLYELYIYYKWNQVINVLQMKSRSTVNRRK